MLKAVVFDFDGVIVNTEPLHHEAFQVVLRPKGIEYSWEEYVEHFIGFDDRDGFRESFRRAGQEVPKASLQNMIDEKAAAFIALIKERGVEPYPGVVALISKLSSVYPLALCSGALRSDIDPILKALDLKDAFQVIVTAEDVQVSKPDPQSFILAVSRLSKTHASAGITTKTCAAIEDTPAGIESAKRAGLRVLAVTNTYPSDQLGEAHALVDSLEHVDAGTLEGMFSV